MLPPLESHSTTWVGTRAFSGTRDDVAVQSPMGSRAESDGKIRLLSELQHQDARTVTPVEEDPFGLDPTPWN